MNDKSSSFDPETFLSTSIEESMDTRYPTIPENDSYLAHIDDITFRKAKDAVLLDVDYLIHDENLATQLGLQQLRVRQGIFLDMTEDGRLQLGPGKNVKLGRLREALGQNKPKAPWNFNMLKGAGPLKISVTVVPDKEDPETKYNRVVRTLPA